MQFEQCGEYEQFLMNISPMKEETKAFSTFCPFCADIKLTDPQKFKMLKLGYKK